MNETVLNDAEVRVLGCLMEKSMTTPDLYPLTLNALTLACNQKSNRHPVVDYDEKTVVRALDSLREKRLAVQGDSTRVFRYSEIFTSSRNLVQREKAVLTVLFLRGPQTVGELRTRTERMYPFDSLEEVESTLEVLAENGFVVQLPRQPGRKESRFAHLLSGTPDPGEEPIPTIRPEPARASVMAENERLAALESEVRELKTALEELQSAFLIFKGQFD